MIMKGLDKKKKRENSRVFTFFEKVKEKYVICPYKRPQKNKN